MTEMWLLLGDGIKDNFILFVLLLCISKSYTVTAPLYFKKKKKKATVIVKTFSPFVSLSLDTLSFGKHKGASTGINGSPLF